MLYFRYVGCLLAFGALGDFEFYIVAFFFYSDEHLPIHVHVKNGAGEAKFEIATDKIILKQSFGMKSKDLKMAEDLILQHQDLIIDHWIKYFNK